MNINKLCSLTYESDCKSVFLSWKTTPLSDEFRHVMDKLIEGMAENKTGKILTDTTNMGAIDPDDQQWSVTDWLERALKVGYNRLALILPDEIFTQMSVNDIISQVEGTNPVSIQYFNNIPDARAWLKSQ